MKNKTASISVRIDEDLKHEFFEHLEKECKTFSKWLRQKMIDELEKKQEGKK
jgi:antitoxin component of RelBE/YafQ-DinJ toxin-antitoxin module